MALMSISSGVGLCVAAVSRVLAHKCRNLPVCLARQCRAERGDKTSPAQPQSTGMAWAQPARALLKPKLSHCSQCQSFSSVHVLRGLYP